MCLHQSQVWVYLHLKATFSVLVDSKVNMEGDLNYLYPVWATQEVCWWLHTLLWRKDVRLQTLHVRCPLRHTLLQVELHMYINNIRPSDLNELFLYLRSNDKTDLDVLRENHRFLWRDEDEEDMSWYLVTLTTVQSEAFSSHFQLDLSFLCWWRVG